MIIEIIEGPLTISIYDESFIFLSYFIISYRFYHIFYKCSWERAFEGNVYATKRNEIPFYICLLAIIISYYFFLIIIKNKKKRHLSSLFIFYNLYCEPQLVWESEPFCCDSSDIYITS
jgi:hypothetical protein